MEDFPFHQELDVQWDPTEEDSIPLVRWRTCGAQDDEHDVCLGFGKYNGSWIPAKVEPNGSKCWIPYKGKEIQSWDCLINYTSEEGTSFLALDEE